MRKGRSYFRNARNIQGPTRRFFSTSVNVILELDMYSIIMEGVELGFDNLCGGGNKTKVSTNYYYYYYYIQPIISNMYIMVLKDYK